MEKKILIGSKATKHWFPDFPREPKDTDFICYKTNRKVYGREIVEYHYSPAFDWLLNHEDNIASPNALYTIKLSHSFWDIKWDKTMYDIEFFQKKGAVVLEEFYQLLYKDWESLHGSKKVNLNVPNEEFFNKYVSRKHLHDDIHRAIMYYDEPMYNKLKLDKNKAWVDRKMFEALSYSDQLLTAREEIYVTAIERELIPTKFDCPAIIAYRRALKQLITSMTKGWFARFLVENYPILKRPDTYYKFKEICRNKSLW